MKFEVTVKRMDTGVKVWIKEEDLEELFTPRAQVLILNAYAKSIEDKSKIDRSCYPKGYVKELIQ